MQRTKNRDKKKLEEYKNLIEGDEIAKNNALIAFYYKVNPETLTDDEWCLAVAQIDFNLQYNGTRTLKE